MASVKDTALTVAPAGHGATGLQEAGQEGGLQAPWRKGDEYTGRAGRVQRRMDGASGQAGKRPLLGRGPREARLSRLGQEGRYTGPGEEDTEFPESSGKPLEGFQ